MIEVNQVSACRGERLLFQNCNFRISAGDILYIRGQNGIGKTTLLRILCALVRPHSGTVTWNGKNIFKMDDEYRRQFIYVGHENGIKADLSALENIRFDMHFRGGQPDVSETEIISRLDIAHFAAIPCRYLSAGQKRRVALARALSSNAPLWLLDEPLTALDETGRALIIELLAEHQRHGGVCIATSHQPLASQSLEVTELDLSQMQ